MAQISPTSHSNDIEDDDIDERQHFLRIINAFRYYRKHSLKRVLQSEKSYNELPAHHREMIPTYCEHLQKIMSCVEVNYEIIMLIVKNTDHMFENKDHGPVGGGAPLPGSEFDMDKVRSTIKQFARDWSPEGQSERDSCYRPIINQILQCFPLEECLPSSVNILVPGAGLGRLAFEIAQLGYTCQGNEFSLFMLFASNFILNKCKEVNEFTIYPWVHQFCNNMKSSDQVQAITFPDVNPSELPEHAQFSMAAGDFLEVYTEPEVWDCVASVFFIDTAHNILQYIETIYHILKPGGYWINLGPLLYHFADMPSESSIELSYDDVRKVIQKFNFEILKEDTNVPASYTQNPRSMMQYHYQCVFFVARKPLEAR